MVETDAHLAAATETWLGDDRAEEDRLNLSLGAGMGVLWRNRKANPRGVAYGGVALVWKEGEIEFKRVDIKNPEEYEVIGAGRIPGQKRKLVLVCCYLPPNYNKN